MLDELQEPIRYNRNLQKIGEYAISDIRIYDDKNILEVVYSLKAVNWKFWASVSDGYVGCQKLNIKGEC